MSVGLSGLLYLLWWGVTCLYCYHSLDVRVCIVVFKREVLELEREDVLYIGVYYHAWQLLRFACELQSCLLDMVQLEVCITQRVYELTCLEACYLCHHLQQQCI